MKTGLILSILLHASFLLVTMLVESQPVKNKQTTIEVAVQKEKQPKKRSNGVEIIPKSNKGEKKAAESQYYFGIGISISLIVDKGMAVYIVNEVIPGYPADYADIRVGDIIYLINGLTIDQRDITGKEPEDITISIRRGYDSIVLNMTTEKIYYGR